MELKKTYDNIAREIEAMSDDLANAETPEAQAAIFEMITQLQIVLERKQEAYLSVYQKLNGQLDYIKGVIENARAAKEVMENKIVSFKALMMAMVKLHGPIKHPLFSAYTTEPVSTIIDDMAALPEAFKKSEVVWTADKKAIKEALSAGGEIPGAHLEKSESITIKMKGAKSE